MSDPLVSIIIPTYNAADFLADTLASCFHQDYENIEVIVVDDGSQDATTSVVETFMLNESRLQLFKSINQGQCVSRNIGIALSTGEYLKFLDHDDLLTPWSIAYQLRALQMFSADIAIGKPIKCNNLKIEGTYQDLSNHPPEETEPLSLWEGKVVEANRQLSPTPNEMLILRETMVKAGGFNRFLATGEEANLMLKIQICKPDSKVVKTLGKIVVCKRVYEGALSVALRKDTFTSWGLASLIDRAQFVLEGKHEIDKSLRECLFDRLYISASKMYRSGKKGQAILGYEVWKKAGLSVPPSKPGFSQALHQMLGFEGAGRVQSTLDRVTDFFKRSARSLVPPQESDKA